MIANLPHNASVFDLATQTERTGPVLREEISVRAAHMRKSGGIEGSKIIVSHDNPANMLLDVLAIWHLGATAIPLSTSLVADEQIDIASRLRADLYVGDNPVGNIPAISAIPTDRQEREIPAPTTRSGADIPLILITSGTSAAPKCVALSKQALQARIDLNIKHIGRDNLQRTLVMLPLHFGHGLIGNTLTALFAGGQVIVGAGSSARSLARLGVLIDTHGITFLSSVPSLWRMALKLSPPPQKSSLQRIHVGSESLSGPLWKSIQDWAGGADVFNMYGMTETANWIAGISGREADFESGNVGTPWGGELALRGDDGEVVCSANPGVSGEILIDSPSIMKGYIGEAEASSKAFHENWFRTGDLGTIDQSGRLKIVGRIKNQINCAGTKISMEEVERLLETHPEVSEACTTALPDPVSGELVAAALVLSDGSKLTAGEIQSWCRSRIRQEAVPVRIILLPSLPKTQRGKLDRRSVEGLMTEG